MMNNPFMAIMQNNNNNNNFSGNNPPINVELFRRFLPRISSQEIENIKQMAKQMGMSDDQISQGMNILSQFK